MTAQEWIEAAIACGRDPYLCVRTTDGGWTLITSCDEVDWDRDPGAYPDGLGRPICEKLLEMGRTWPPKD